jgi:hypothetical protein
LRKLGCVNTLFVIAAEAVSPDRVWTGWATGHCLETSASDHGARMEVGMEGAIRYGKACLGAVILGAATLDLTGNPWVAGVAALLPLGLGLPNLAPFATLGVPVLAAVAALGARLWPESAIDMAAATLWENAGHVRAVILAGLQVGGAE